MKTTSVSYEYLSAEPFNQSDYDSIIEILKEYYVVNKGGAKKLDLTPEKFIRVLTNHVVIVARTEHRHIVGMVVLVTYERLDGSKLWLERLLVLEKFRRCGIARGLCEKAILYARNMGVSDKLDLTSLRDKSGVRKLYRDLGFVRRDSDVFELDLNKGKSKQ